VLAGTLKVDVETILPLDEAADGLATLASGQARGKIAIRISRRRRSWRVGPDGAGDRPAPLDHEHR
jgi:hypothetical protein